MLLCTVPGIVAGGIVLASETEHLTVVILNTKCMHTTSQEYLIKLLIGDSHFYFVIETIVFHSVILLFLCVTLEDRLLKGLLNVAKISSE